MSPEKVSAGAPAGAEAPAEIPEQWSAARKAEVVLRVLRGEAIDSDEAARAGGRSARKKWVWGGTAEARAMSTECSRSTGRRYPLTMICQVYRVARSTVYVQATGEPVTEPAPKRGPKTTVSDAELLVVIRRVLADAPFHGEGHRKVRVRLRAQGHRVGRGRVLRLMRVAGLWRRSARGIRTATPRMPARS
jgi:hypothetical protein